MSNDTPLPAFHAGKPSAPTTFGSASTHLLAPQLLFEAVRAQAAARPAAGSADGRQPTGNDSRRS